jgi:hypothetical protein
MSRKKQKEYRHLKVAALNGSFSVLSGRKPPVPTLRLKGYYLNEYGFRIGDFVTVRQLLPGVLIIRAIRKPEANAPGLVAKLPNEATPCEIRQ